MIILSEIGIGFQSCGIRILEIENVRVEVFRVVRITFMVGTHIGLEAWAICCIVVEALVISSGKWIVEIQNLTQRRVFNIRSVGYIVAWLARLCLCHIIWQLSVRCRVACANCGRSVIKDILIVLLGVVVHVSIFIAPDKGTRLPIISKFQRACCGTVIAQISVCAAKNTTFNSSETNHNRNRKRIVVCGIVGTVVNTNCSRYIHIGYAAAVFHLRNKTAVCILWILVTVTCRCLCHVYKIVEGIVICLSLCIGRRVTVENLLGNFFILTGFDFLHSAYCFSEVNK